MLFSYYRTAHSENEQFEQLRQIMIDRKTENDTPDETLAPANVATDSDNTPPVGDTAEPPILSHMARLHAINPDIAAWIRVDSTKINYPVMFTPNEPQKYLRKAFDGKYSESGVPFIGGGTLESDNIIIYGHNMKNGTMFSDLLKYERKDFWEAHKTVYLDTLYEQREYEIIAAFRSRAYAIGETGFRYYRYADFGDEEAYNEYMGQLNRAALYETGVSVAYGDTFITLSTCAYHVTDGRFVVVARRIK